MPKRYRRQKLKEGELRVYWGKLPHEDPDLIYSWQGDYNMKRDSRMLAHHFDYGRVDITALPECKFLPSLLQELEERGYDITTLKFGIMKKPT